MTQFAVPWRPPAPPVNYRVPLRLSAVAVLLIVVGLAGPWLIGVLAGLVTLDVPDPVAVFLGRVGPWATAALVFLAAFVVNTWRSWGKPLQRMAGMILVGAIVSVCVGTFAVRAYFNWLDGPFMAAADDPAAATWFDGALTFREITANQPEWVPGWAACFTWAFQFPAVRDIFALLVLFGFINIIPAYLIWWERKIAGRIQSRLGPMRVGMWHGWAQTVADGIKLVQKEDLIPAEADRPLFRLAPYLAFVPAAAAFVALPFGAQYVFRDLDVALVFILAILGIEVVGVIIAGWASNNKWSVYGSMREACQMVSYEIPMGLALMLPVIAAGSLKLSAIAEDQGNWWNWMAFRNPFLFAGFVTYFIAALANCKRAPFDLPESESELVAGFLTEYSGFRWCLFFFAEYCAMFLVAGLCTILYLGGWNSPFGDSLTSGPLWFVLKCVFLLYCQLWVRWTLPRIRIDQVLYACVQVLLPLTMLLLVGNTIWVWADTSDSAAWANVATVVKYILGTIGLFFAAGFVVIAIGGFIRRRQLVGTLSVDPLPAG